MSIENLMRLALPDTDTYTALIKQAEDEELFVIIFTNIITQKSKPEFAQVFSVNFLILQ